jgi:hypothetical protein
MNKILKQTEVTLRKTLQHIHTKQASLKRALYAKQSVRAAYATGTSNEIGWRGIMQACCFSASIFLQMALASPITAALEIRCE